MNYEEELITTKLELERLKINVQINNLVNYINLLKVNWNPRTKEVNGTIGHGSKSGDEINFLLYFDEYKQEWTTKEMAFRGFVFKQILEKKIID